MNFQNNNQDKLLITTSKAMLQPTHKKLYKLADGYA